MPARFRRGSVVQNQVLLQRCSHTFFAVIKPSKNAHSAVCMPAAAQREARLPRPCGIWALTRLPPKVHAASSAMMGHLAGSIKETQQNKRDFKSIPAGTCRRQLPHATARGTATGKRCLSLYSPAAPLCWLFMEYVTRQIFECDHPCLNHCYPKPLRKVYYSQHYHMPPHEVLLPHEVYYSQHGRMPPHAVPQWFYLAWSVSCRPLPPLH